VQITKKVIEKVESPVVKRAEKAVADKQDAIPKDAVAN
jgi:hypothetical protein